MKGAELMKTKKVVLFLCTMLVACLALGFEFGLKPVNRIMSPYPDGGGGGDPLPNLKLTVAYPASLVTEGSKIHFTIKVKNDGAASSVPCKMAFIKSLDIIKWFDVPAIAIGVTKTYTYDYTVDCGVQVMIWLDDNKNTESNENDNSWAKTFNCTPIYHIPDVWVNFKMINLKKIETPVPCTNCPPWHKRLKQGDPVDVLNKIADKIVEGKSQAEVESDWKFFLENNNGLDPASALEIIFNVSVEKAKVKFKEEAEILNFQKNLTNIMLGLHSITAETLGSN